MRAFLALWPDPDTAMAIDRWRMLCWRDQPGAVPIQNLHITVAFLGEIRPDQAERLAEQLDHRTLPAVSVPLTAVGYQVDRSMLWLEPSPVEREQASALDELVQHARTACAHAGIGVRKGAHRPHMTLARRVGAMASAPLIEPSFTVSSHTLQLSSSQRQPGGPVYRSERTWPLFD